MVQQTTITTPGSAPPTATLAQAVDVVGTTDAVFRLNPGRYRLQQAATVSGYNPGIVKGITATRGLIQSAVGGLVATADIAPRAITWSVVQTTASGTLLGRSSAGAGDVEQITVG